MRETCPRCKGTGFIETSDFRMPCKLNSQPSIGYCTLKEYYDDCLVSEYGKRMKNNWMCWRDGILKES